jgi:hypothetical protein
MASPAEHEKWAKHNEDFAKWLDGKWPQWITVALFYAALHYVDAFLRGDHGWNPTREEEKHGVRNDYLRKHFGELARPYLRLFQWGHDARYNCAAKPPVERAFEALEQVKAEIAHLRAAKTNGV